jgi:hypothetical protein
MAEPALKFMDGSGFTADGQEVAAPTNALNLAEVSLVPKKSIPAEAVANPITNGDVGSLLKQNQKLFQEQLRAFDLSPDYIKARQSFNEVNNQLTRLTNEKFQRAADLRSQPGEITQPIVGRQLNALEREIGYRQLPLSQQLQAITGQLQILQEERNNTLAKLQLMAEQGRYDANLAMQFNEIRRQEQKEARALAREYGIESPFYVEGGTIYRTSDGKAYSNPEQFFQDARVSSFDQARKLGILSDLGESLAMKLQREQMQLQRDQFSWGQQMDLARLGLDEQKFYADLAQSGITINKDGSFNVPQITAYKQDIVDINGTKTLVTYDKLGNVVNRVPLSGNDAANISQIQQQAVSKANIDQIDSVLNSKGFNSAVGPNYLARFSVRNQLTGEKAKVIGAIQQITEQLTLDKLIQAKANGATFGALSDGERQMLAAAASKIGTWAIKDKNGNVTGYKVNEKTMRDELNKIQQFAKLDYILRGGNLADIKAITTPDGAIWTQNQDGTRTMLLDPAQASRIQSFQSAGNALDSNQVKGMMQRAQPLPLLNMDGSTKTPNIPLMKAFPPGSFGGQCGVWVRQIVNKMGLNYPPVGNSLAEKAAVAKKYGVPLSKARVGSILLTAENKDNGHVAMIIGITPQGFRLAESNYGLNQKVSYGRIIPFNSPLILGVLNPTKG